MQDDGDGEQADKADKADRKSAATILVEIARELYEFGVSDSGETYGAPRQGAQVVLMLRGGKTSLRGQLSREYFRRKGRAAGAQALTDALVTLDGFAQEAEPVRLWQRVARRGGSLWLDLGDSTGRAVRITGDGWLVAARPPVLFRRTALGGPLPEPAPGGTLGRLWNWLNVTQEDRPLITAWLVATFWPDMPHPILGLFGEQGTGKTTTLKGWQAPADHL